MKSISFRQNFPVHFSYFHSITFGGVFKLVIFSIEVQIVKIFKIQHSWICIRFFLSVYFVVISCYLLLFSDHSCLSSFTVHLMVLMRILIYLMRQRPMGTLDQWEQMVAMGTWRTLKLFLIKYQVGFQILLQMNLLYEHYT